MEPPVTPKPMPASAPDLPTNHTGKLFGIVYITLTGVIDTIILAASLCSWLSSCGWHCPQKTWPELPLKTTGRPPKTGSLKYVGIVFLQPVQTQYNVKLGKVNDGALDGGMQVLKHEREGGSFPCHGNVMFIS
ncbi:hypothetical protein DSO57_1017941 [Entomophthora muscae]|uniref:Uncharacterized protein n=1 Tax=Entomophthora muscae TaxID=34485 RepID=A0ACC2TS52_9FUNG|nr:hypothetical protein DSO57_1017941 [Entomophthora muscae]